MAKDDWLTAAMTDDAVVVELLFRLKHSLASPSHAAIPFAWGLKQPRSRPFPSFRCHFLSHRITKLDSTRCSPSTPLSWTGRLSSAPTSDASEGSSLPACFSPASTGSKETDRNASAAATTPAIKKSRKKKTLAELKIEEGLLSDDRSPLGKKLAASHGTFKEHTVNKESFKRMKLNWSLKSSSTLSCISAGREKTSAKTNGEVGFHHMNQSLLIHKCGDDGSLVDILEAGNNNVDGGHDFLLPDLNMTPSEIEKCECI